MASPDDSSQKPEKPAEGADPGPLPDDLLTLASAAASQAAEPAPAQLEDEPPAGQTASSPPAAATEEAGTPAPASDSWALPAPPAVELPAPPASELPAPPASELPAHLSLPNMDLTLPDLAGISSQGGAGGELPAHLNLPSFPDVGMAPIPLGETPADPFGQKVAAPGTAPPPPPIGPPTIKPTPPRLRGQGSGLAGPPPLSRGGAMGLDDLTLPDLAPPAPKRNLTLLAMPGSDETGPRRAVWPFVLIALLAVGGVAGVLARDRILGWFVPKKVSLPVPAAALPSPKEQAQSLFAEGAQAYTAKDFPKAVERFERALALDGTLAEAHRGLGIVYATTHDKDRAVAHYKKYLELAPHAADAPEVQRIVADYLQAAAAAAPPKPDVAKTPPMKKAKAKHRRR